MAKPGVTLLPSVLDRLIDDPTLKAPAQRSRNQELAALRNAVRRDLEALLNAHCLCVSPPPGLNELDKSVVEYGIPDFLGVFAGSDDVRETFRKSLEDTIRRYEPRFQTVRVVLPPSAGQLDRTLRFRIEALMYAEPAPENVTFNSQLDPTNHSFSITAGGDG
jgi:type VI secretion system protein ImpF